MKILTFHEVSHALYLESKLKENKEDIKLVPVPRTISSSCSLAGITEADIDLIKKLVEDFKIGLDSIYQINEDNTYTKLFTFK